MKTLHGWRRKRGLIAFAVLSLMACAVAVNAVNICHVHTSGGYEYTEFSPRSSADLYLDVKAPSSGVLWAYVDAGGMTIVGQINVSDGDRNNMTIPYSSLSQLNEFGSQVSNYGSGTGYASLTEVGGTTSPCIPTGGGS